MQQALIPIAAAAGLVALAGGALALSRRSEPATQEVVDTEDDEFGTPESDDAQHGKESDDEFGTPESDDDHGPKSDDESCPLAAPASVAIIEREVVQTPAQGCTVEYFETQLRALKDKTLELVGRHDYKKILAAYFIKSTAILSDAISCRLSRDDKQRLRDLKVALWEDIKAAIGQ